MMKEKILKNQLKERGFYHDDSEIQVRENTVGFTFDEVDEYKDPLKVFLKPFIKLMVDSRVRTEITNPKFGQIAVSVERKHLEDYIIDCLIEERGQTALGVKK
jgi:hypothetical protein